MPCLNEDVEVQPELAEESSVAHQHGHGGRELSVDYMVMGMRNPLVGIPPSAFAGYTLELEQRYSYTRMGNTELPALVVLEQNREEED